MSGTLVLTCEQCGMQWERPRLGGPSPRVCPVCQYTATPHRDLPDYDVAKKITTYRSAIELAKACLRTHRYDEALAALTEVDRP